MMDPAEISLMTALIAAVGALWKHIGGNIRDLRRHIRDLRRRTDECEKDRMDIHERLERLGKELAVFKSCAADPCPARQGLRRAESFNLKPNP